MEHGQAELVAMKNFGAIEKRPDLASIQDKRDFLVDYSARNTRIKKAQFHAAISCKGREYSREELEKIGWEYLRRMGYGEDGQPVLMYYHHDTGNNHLHIVTSRVAPSGRKISDSNEKMRSLKAIESIMFMAIFETSGYEAYKQDGDICIKRGGEVQGRIAVKDVENLCRKNGDEEKKRICQLRAILKKYRDQSCSREELEAVLKKKFGISIKFLGKEFSPYGYMLVDNATKTVFKGSDILTKTVFKGSDILGVKELLQFQSREEKLRKADFFIEDKLKGTFAVPKSRGEAAEGRLLHRGQAERATEYHHL